MPEDEATEFDEEVRQRNENRYHNGGGYNGYNGGYNRYGGYNQQHNGYGKGYGNGNGNGNGKGKGKGYGSYNYNWGTVNKSDESDDEETEKRRVKKEIQKVALREYNERMCNERKRQEHENLVNAFACVMNSKEIKIDSPKKSETKEKKPNTPEHMREIMDFMRNVQQGLLSNNGVPRQTVQQTIPPPVPQAAPVAPPQTIVPQQVVPPFVQTMPVPSAPMMPPPVFPNPIYPWNPYQMNATPHMNLSNLSTIANDPLGWHQGRGSATTDRRSGKSSDQDTFTLEEARKRLFPNETNTERKQGRPRVHLVVEEDMSMDTSMDSVLVSTEQTKGILKVLQLGCAHDLWESVELKYLFNMTCKFKRNAEKWCKVLKNMGWSTRLPANKNETIKACFWCAVKICAPELLDSCDYPTLEGVPIPFSINLGKTIPLTTTTSSGSGSFPQPNPITSPTGSTTFGGQPLSSMQRAPSSVHTRAMRINAGLGR